MNDKSKLMLSDGEMQLVTNSEWILTKRKIINTVNLLLGTVAEKMQEKIITQKDMWPPAVTASTPKIAKGENYRQLPYVILDYPRCFDKQNIFAVRTMFWWGNFFSCTLHLSGSYKAMFIEALQKNIPLMQKNNFYICINKEEWEHHLENDNYLSVASLTTAAIISILSQQHFIKVAAKISLQEWKTMDVLLEKYFSELLCLLKN